jgi:predicted GH43/DUF377 family glycosyl hydrolase
MTDFKLKRIGMIMEPKAGDPNEAEGVLNPAAIRAQDGQLYLFPRLVARGNYSRIGIARVLFDRYGDPREVERMGVALEPEADYELSENGGGCEDPRVTYVEPLQQYVMTTRHFRAVARESRLPFPTIFFTGVESASPPFIPIGASLLTGWITRTPAYFQP